MADLVLETAAFLVVFVAFLAIPGVLVADHQSTGKPRKAAVPRKRRAARRRARRTR